MDGEGTLRMQDDYKYRGQFKNGLKNGHGIMEDKNGVRYEGEWKNDMKNGPFQVRSGSSSRIVNYVNDREIN